MKKHAFTLIELLVVVGIILILVGITFPVYALIKKKAQVTKTKAQINQLKVAITGYKSTYQFLPWTPSYSDDVLLNAPGGALPVSDGYQVLISALSEGSSTGYAANPRGIRFLELETPGTFADPWGNSFWVALDLDYDDSIPTDFIYGDGELGLDYVIWSKGPDGKHSSTDTDGTNDDNVTSWK